VKVLVAEDDPVTRRMLEAALSQWSYEAVSCSDGNAAWEALQGENAPRLALLDWVMPGLDGLELCRRLRRRPSEDYVYILFLTVKGRKAEVVEGLDAGADDYLVKPFDRSELEARLRAGQRILDLQAQLIAAREALRDRATHDPLTGLWNRAAILDVLRREVARSQREAQPLAVCMADIDHFKQVNDTHGHMVGDALLSEVARRLASAVRAYDSIGRYGGDEFLCILPACDARRAAAVAERIRRAIADEPIETPQTTHAVTVSLGVAATDEGTDPALFVHAADTALYRAKHAGRNRVEIASTADAAVDLTSEAEPAPAGP